MSSPCQDNPNESALYRRQRACHKGGFNNPDKDRRVSEENWIIIPDTHEPFVSRERFEEVQKKIKMSVKKLHAHNAALEHEKTPKNFFSG